MKIKIIYDNNSLSNINVINQISPNFDLVSYSKNINSFFEDSFGLYFDLIIDKVGNYFWIDFVDISEKNINEHSVSIETILQNIIQELKIIDKNMIIDFYLDNEENNFINRVKKLILKI